MFHEQLERRNNSGQPVDGHDDLHAVRSIGASIAGNAAALGGPMDNPPQMNDEPHGEDLPDPEEHLACTGSMFLGFVICHMPKPAIQPGVQYPGERKEGLAPTM